MSTQLASISPALSRLLSNSIDYAGLFPPASLPLSEALDAFKRYLTGRESWIIGSIVLPIERLGEAADSLPETPFRLSAIPRRSDDPALWLTRLQEDRETLQAFSAVHPQVAIQALEIPLPKPSEAGESAKRVDELAPLLNGYRVFLELPPGTHSFREELSAMIAALERHRLPDWGLKVRMGGMVSEAFPSTATVAGVLATVRDHRVPIKFTAGLHHPLHHWDNELGVHMHGFINVLMAAMFAYACRLPPKNIETIIADERSKDFAFNGNVARWLDLPLRTELIEDLRRLVCGFGSCSVEEPWHDLRALGWVD
jgi:hypothetical protein